jgi:hypothetical protein
MCWNKSISGEFMKSNILVLFSILTMAGAVHAEGMYSACYGQASDMAEQLVGSQSNVIDTSVDSTTDGLNSVKVVVTATYEKGKHAKITVNVPVSLGGGSCTYGKPIIK